MKINSKVLFGVILGYLAYTAYNKLRRTQTVMITEPESQYNPIVMDTSTIAGLRG